MKQYFLFYEILALRNFTNWSEEFPLTDELAVGTECGRLYQAAMNGDWKAVKDMPNIQRKITKKEETTLHIGAAANQEIFVKN